MNRRFPISVLFLELLLLRFGACSFLYLALFQHLGVGYAAEQDIPHAPKQMLVRTWDAEDGMPQSTGRCIAQTPDGFIWAGTFNGLVRFDGVGFEVFDMDNTPALPENDIYSLFVDLNGRLWILTNSKGVVVYEKGKFSFPRQPPGMNLTINAAETSDGQLFFSSREGVFLAKANEFVPVVDAVDLNADMGGICGDSKDGLVIFTYSGLWQWNREALLEFPNYQSMEIHMAVRDVSDNIWVLYLGKEENAMTHIDLLDMKSQVVIASFSGPFSSCLVADPDREGVWVGLKGGGVAHYTRSGKNQVSWNPELPGYNVGSLFFDSQARLWIGSDGGGISMAMPQHVKSITDKQGLTSNNVITVGQVPDGRMMAGTYFHGLTIQSHESIDRWEPLGGPWQDATCLSILQRRDGTVLVAGSRGTVLFDGERIDYSKLNGPQNEAIEKQSILARLSKDGPEVTLPGYRYRALMETEDGALWIGSRFFGAYRIMGDQVQIFDSDDLPNLGQGRINSFLEDREGCVWIGTSTGLNRWLPDGTVERIGVEQGVPPGEIHSLGMDSTGRVLVGTGGSGLGVLRTDSMHFRMLGAGNGLPNEVVAQIIEDDSGYLWLGTNAGICRLSISDLNQFAKGETDWVTISRYGRQSGMVNPECTGGFQPSCYKDKNGKLWFSTVGGLVTVDPADFQKSQESPTAHIRKIMVGSRDYTSDTGQFQSQVPSFEIEPNPGILEIQYTGLSFDDPLSLRFQYRLSGYDNDWVDVGAERVARYPNLPPGQFEFEVRVRNHLGVWNMKPEAVTIIIRPAWWETRAFQGVMGCLVLLSGFGAHRYRIKLLERTSVLHETFSKRSAQFQEQDRKRIASDLHDTVAQELLLIRRQTQRILRDSHLNADHRARIEGVDDTTRSALEDLRHSIYMLWPRELENATPYEAVRSLLDRIAQESGLRIDADIEALTFSLPVGFKIHLYRILQEALQNIIKHAHATSLELSVKVKDDVCHILINDDGIGMETGPSKLESYGLATMNYRAHWINGELTLHSEPGQGVRVHLRFPIP